MRYDDGRNDLRVITAILKGLSGPCLMLGLVGAASAQSAGSDYPTTEFDGGSQSAAVTVGPLTANVSVMPRPDADPDFDSPVLTVTVDGREVLEVVGVASGFDFPATEASIADIDRANSGPEVYFGSYSGGAHCCTQVIVATQVGDRWVAVPIGDFDGDGRYLSDLDGDGVAEIATADNRFLYQFGCYACSAAPLTVMSVHGGKVYDVSGEARYLPAHRDWLEQLEENMEPADMWTSAGYLGGWVAAKIRVGEGLEAWDGLTANWDYAGDEGEEVCLTGQNLDECPRRSRKVLNFPDRLKLFLQQTRFMS